MIQKEDFFLLGKITKFNKKTADVTIITDADSPEAYVNSSVLFLEIDGGLAPFFVKELRLKDSTGMMALLEDYETSEKAQKLVGCRVYLPSTQLSELQDDKFYFHDIIGYTVIDEQAGELGTIAQVLEAPKQDLLQVFYRKKEVLIPLVDEFITRVDKRKKQLFMNLPEGLIDL